MRFLKQRNYPLIIISFILIFTFALSTSTVFAGSLTINGSVDGSDPFGTLASYLGSACDGSYNANYDMYTFQVDTTGTYTIETTLGSLSDSLMMLYSPSFDIANPLNNCIEADDDGGAGLASLITRTLTANTDYIIIVRGNGGGLGSYTLNISGVGGVFLGAVPVPSVVAEDGIPLPAFYDGRINDYDTASPVAIFPHEVDGEIGLVVYDTEGNLLLVISPEQIADAPDNPDGSILIASANGVILYRIAGEGRGYWQLNAPQYNGKTYVMIFPELFHSGGYESFELDV